MNQRLKTILEQAQALAPADRERLAELLYASISSERDHDAAWIDEIEARTAAEARGEARMIPAGEVFAKHRKS